MTDNEIINAWEKILKTGDAPVGEHWSVGGVVTTLLAKETFGMLNRQKSEIKKFHKIADRLKNINAVAYSRGYRKGYAKAKSEAIKEFADRFNSVLADYDDYDTLHIYEIRDRIDLVKEMVGDENG